jgi:hypothetical protein
MLADVSYDNEMIIHRDLAVEILIKEDAPSQKFNLKENYPNPFNPTTTIPFDVLDEGHMTLGIYDVNGQLVRQLVNEDYVSGSYTAVWDGRNNEGKEMHSGIYVYLMTSDKLTLSGKMLLVK